MPRPRLGAWVFVLYGGFLAATCSLGLAWLDAGELTTAARALGVPHPTGYPVFVLIGHAASFLPIGDVATRVAFASALLGAIALLFIYRAAFALAVRAGADEWAAEIAGTLAAGVTQANSLFWLHAAATEVYAAGGAVVAAVLWLAAMPATPRRALLAAVLTGAAAGLGTEARLGVLLPAIVVLVMAMRRRPGSERARLLAAAFAVCSWTAVMTLLYLPIRAATHPVMNWGAPDDAGALWAHLTGARIRLAYGGQMWSAAGASETARLLAGAAGLPALLLAAIGLTRIPKGTWAAAWVAGAGLAYAALVNPMGNRDLQNGLTVAAGIALLAAMGAVRLGQLLPERARVGLGRVHFLLAACALIAMAGALPYALGHLAGTPIPRGGDAVRAAIAKLPPRSLLAVESDHLAGGTLYAMGIEGARPDVAVVVQQHAWDLTYLRAALERAGPLRDYVSPGTFASLERREPGERAALALAEVVSFAFASRTVAWEPGEHDAVPRLAGGRGLSPGWPVWQVAPATAEPPFLVAQVARFLEQIDAGSLPRPGRLTCASWMTHSATLAGAAGDVGTAVALLETAVALAPESAAAWTNLGVIASRVGRYDEAVALTERALSIAPRDLVALVNAGRYYLARGQPGDEELAENRYSRAIEAAPSPASVTGRRLRKTIASAWAGRGIVAARRGEYERAEIDLIEALALDPESTEAKANLDRVRVARDESL